MSQARVELIPMQCVRCQQALAAQPDEVVWVCPNCGQGQILSDDKGLLPQTVRFADGIPPNMTGKPMWVAEGKVTLHRETYSGNNEREMEQFWAQPRWFFIPAYNLTLEQLSMTGVNLLKKPLILDEVVKHSPFLPITIHPEDIRPLAEFILLAVEAERKDQLRNLTYDLQLGSPDLWIFA